MSQPSAPQASVPPVWPMYRAMVGVGLICGVLIVGVYLGTRPVIQRKRAEALERAIFQVLPEARSSRNFRMTEDGHFVAVGEGSTAGPRVHAGYDAEGHLVGLAVEASGMGYQDVIAVLYGYSPTEDALIGMRVLESRETPGLGDRIETDPAFQANFEHLDVALVEDGSRIAHPIQLVKHGQKEHAWQVDGITGATISSTAIASILRASTATWIPRLRRNLDDFREGG
jgi:electron transport complex protein RnfG